MGRRRILFVHGLDTGCRARDVAHEFERYGRIARCDIPAPRSGGGSSGYAFVEFEDARDAEDAYHELHGKRFAGGVLKIQWARRPPTRQWRDEERDGRRSPPRRRSRSPALRNRSRSPVIKSGSRSPSPMRDANTKVKSYSRSPSPLRFRPPAGEGDGNAAAASQE